jgi:hypothetical protein
MQKESFGPNFVTQTTSIVHFEQHKKVDLNFDV